VADWSPLAEDDPVSGDVLGLSQLILRLRAQAAVVRDTAQQLRLADTDGIWKGDAATPFLERRGQVLPELDLVAVRIETASIALERFRPALDDAQSRARLALARAQAAQAQITQAQVGIETAARQAADAQRAAEARAAEFPDLPPPPPEAFWGPNWHGQLTDAEAELAAARRLFADACQIYKAAERTCDETLGEAIHDDLADPKHRGVFGTVGHAFANIADHFTDLEKFSELLGATAAVCGVAALFPPLAFLEPVALAATGLKTLVDIDLAATDRKGWGEVGKDAVGLALFGASRYATVASRGSVANKAAQDLRGAKALARANRIKDIEKTTEEGQALTGRAAYRFITKRSDKILAAFGKDQYAGALPSWRRTMVAMRHLDIELPEAEVLSISPTALKWAVVAESATVSRGVLDSQELGTFMDDEHEKRHHAL
jgi:hypothetical protein